MKRKSVFFRVDGSAQIGLGHVVRCIALADMLKGDFVIRFFCKEIPEQLIKEITGSGFLFSLINDEADFFISINEKNIVVLDSYKFDIDYHKKIKSYGCKLVCIDDLHDKEFAANLIINHAPGIQPSDYKAQSYTQYALGLDYVILRPVFLIKSAIATGNREIKTVFVCFGGSDPKNITQVVANVLKIDKRFEKIIIVTGSVYENTETLRLSIQSDARFTIYHAVSASEMCDLITQSELAIVPSSGILQEVISLNVKVISGMYVENQKFIFENYKQVEAFESAEDFHPDKIRSAINRSFEKKMCVNAKRLIDGRSGERLLKIFKSFK